MQDLLKQTRKRHAMIAIAQWFDTSLAGHIGEQVPTWSPGRAGCRFWPCT